MKFKYKSEFAKNVLILLSGTTISQIVPIVISPVLTRIYNPSEFGLFALFISLVTFLSIFSTGRYEVPIILPKDDSDGINLVSLSFFLASTFSFLLIFLIIILHESLVLLLDSESISTWLYFVPITVLLTAYYNTMNYWFNRLKKFRLIANNRIFLSLTMAFTQLAVGYMIISNGGLIIGYIIAQTLAVLYFMFIFNKHNKKVLRLNVTIKLMKENAKKYINFPKFSLAADSINSLSNQAPIFLFTSLFSPAVAGFYALTFRILNTPSKFISKAIMDVFKQKASEDFNKKGNCKRIFINTFKKLLFISIIPFVIIGIWGSDIFSIVFGKEWENSGLYAQILAPFFFLRFIVSPLTYTLYIANNQRLDLILQTFLLISTISAIYFGSVYEDEILGITAFSSSYSIIYLIYFYFSYKSSKGYQ